MITNASITHIDIWSGSTGAGDPFFGSASDIDAGYLPCFAGEITSSQRFTLGAELKDANRVLYVPERALQKLGITPPKNSDQVTVQMDAAGGATPEAAEVVEVIRTRRQALRAGSAVNHYEIYGKVAG